MKVQKTIEVEVCDLCGKESRPSQCKRCKGMACNRCQESISVQVDRYVPEVGHGPILGVRKTEHRVAVATYCLKCAGPIVGSLRAIGLIDSPREDLPVMDAVGVE